MEIKNKPKYEIKNKPKYADNYEFIVASICDGEYWFYGAYTDGFKAEQVAIAIDGVVFHNVRIQGVKR